MTSVTKPVRFVGAGVGRAGLCSYEGVEYLRECEVCLYDSLLDDELLKHLPKNAERIYVGKRCHAHSFPQKDISLQIRDHALLGKKVVRLKGGDPTVFGRIAEEIDVLQASSIPFTITPAVSSYQCAAVDAGVLLTKRGVSSGFTVMTARDDQGELTSLKGISEFYLPVIFYMGTKIVDQLCSSLIDEGISPLTSVSIVYNAGSRNTEIVKGTLTSFVKGETPINSIKRPGVVIVGAKDESSFLNMEAQY